MVISTHLIADIEPVLDDVVMIQNGMLRLHKSVDAIHNETWQVCGSAFQGGVQMLGKLLKYELKRSARKFFPLVLGYMIVALIFSLMLRYGESVKKP